MNVLDGGSLFRTLNNIFATFAGACESERIFRPCRVDYWHSFRPPAQPCIGDRIQLDDGSFGEFRWISFQDVWCLAQVRVDVLCFVSTDALNINKYTVVWRWTHASHEGRLCKQRSKPDVASVCRDCGAQLSRLGEFNVDEIA